MQAFFHFLPNPQTWDRISSTGSSPGLAPGGWWQKEAKAGGPQYSHRVPQQVVPTADRTLHRRVCGERGKIFALSVEKLLFPCCSCACLVHSYPLTEAAMNSSPAANRSQLRLHGRMENRGADNKELMLLLHVHRISPAVEGNMIDKI